MPYILAKIRNVTFEDIKQRLKEHTPVHAKQGFHLEHLWKNVNDSNEVLFLFRVDNLASARQFVEKTHSQARKENPHANLPEMTFLEEERLD